jgi:multiple antibiotic resistance protein
VTLGPLEIFTLLFVTLGPLKLLGPFAHATGASDSATVRQIAYRVFALSTTCVVVAGLGATVLLRQWHISMAALTLAGGIIFFLVALRQLLQQYETLPATAAQSTGTPMALALKLTFPMVVTPYGLAAVIALFAASAGSAGSARVDVIVALLLGVMVLNLLAMLGAHRVMHGVTVLALQVVGAALGVLQVALSVQIVIRGLRELGVPLQ